MSSHLDSSVETFLSFQLKGGLYPLTALQILDPNLAVFDQQLETKIQQAPKFFLHAPVVIDIQKLKPGTSLDFNKLRDILLKKQLVPVGVKGAQPEQQMGIILAGLALFQEGGKDKENTKDQIEHLQNKQQTTQAAYNAQTFAAAEEFTEIKGSNTKVITEPVRSGQQIYARGGDLVVIAPVSHGAELLADGNIHIYGALRGRALAGVTGDQNAHIFCQSLEAELISIAGQYKISEDIDPSIWHLAVDISVVGGRLHIQPF